MTLDEFADMHLEERDDLAFRAISGEALSVEESGRLEDLNRMLDSLLPMPAPLPAHMQETLAAARELLAMRGR